MESCIFCLAEELKYHYAAKAFSCVVWGTGEVAKDVSRTLAFLGIPIVAYGDNNEAMLGSIFEGKPVLGLQGVRDLLHPFVVIGSYVVRPIYEQLSRAGCSHIFVLLDAIKYPISVLLKEREWLQPFFDIYQEKRSRKVLVEVYGDIGDVVIRLGLISCLSRRYAKDRLFALVEHDDVASILRLIVPHVLVVQKEAFLSSRGYRRKVLCQLNGLYFRETFILCDARLHANRRLLNAWNLNVCDVHFSVKLPDQEYLPQLDADFLQDNIPGLSLRDISPKHTLGKTIDSYFPAARFPNMPCGYVAINLGARKSIRRYSPWKFCKVVAHLLRRKFFVALLGKGRDDARWSRIICEEMQGTAMILDFVDQLSLREAFSVIRRARCFIGTDSGMWHAAYALGMPSIVIYGQGEYGCFMHRDSSVHYVMSAAQDCKGCQWYCTHMENGYARCIGSIAPESIIARLGEIIS